MRGPIPGVLALVLNAIGLLLACEVIRPFHDLEKDGPLALTCWGAGFLLSLVALLRGSQTRVLSWVGLVVNALGLLAALALYFVLSHGKLI